MIKIKRNCKEIEEKKSEQNRSQTERKTGEKQGSARFQPLRNRHFVAKPFRNTVEVSAKIFAAAKPILAHECHFAAHEHLFRSCETHCEVKKADFATLWDSLREFSQLRKWKWHTSATSQHRSICFVAAKRIAKW